MRLKFTSRFSELLLLPVDSAAAASNQEHGVPEVLEHGAVAVHAFRSPRRSDRPARRTRPCSAQVRSRAARDDGSYGGGDDDDDGDDDGDNDGSSNEGGEYEAFCVVIVVMTIMAMVVLIAEATMATMIM